MQPDMMMQMLSRSSCTVWLRHSAGSLHRTRRPTRRLHRCLPDCSRHKSQNGKCAHSRTRWRWRASRPMPISAPSTSVAAMPTKRWCGNCTSANSSIRRTTFLVGGAGTGRTHLATAIGVHGLEHHGRRVRFFSTIELVNAPEQTRGQARTARHTTYVCRSGGAG